MAGNIQADNSGNILVEFDYNNIIVVDPNKTIDDFGNVNERLVDHERLVMYANLEAELLPRTKMAIGASANSTGIKTISVAKINFLKPTKQTYLSTGYYDSLTGQDTSNYSGTNQPLEIAQKTLNGQQPYFENTVQNQNNVIDEGLLGITQINITTNTSFVPNVRIELEDVQGKALFQLGENSPYAAFFNLPYPQFYLTLKGYLGQAIRYQLQLKDFNCRFNSFSGNYQISLQFYGYKFNVLAEVSMGHLLALPHMYPDTFTLTNLPVSNQNTSNSQQQSNKTQGTQTKEQSNSQTGLGKAIVTERGYQKIVEVYGEYKAKGLISLDFPELTLAQLMQNLEKFEQNILQSFPPVKLEPLTNIRNYKKQLTTYFNEIRSDFPTSWFSKYLDLRPIILSNDKRGYVFKQDLKEDTKVNARSELQAIITKNNEQLAKNPTLGDGGPNKITNPITYKTISITINVKDIDWAKTTINQTGLSNPTDVEINRIKANFPKIFAPIPKLVDNQETDSTEVQLQPPDFFIFEGERRFDQIIANLTTTATKILQAYEVEITAELAKKIEDTATGIGFRPSARNMVAVLMASADAFIRLMDEVHVNAWNVKYDPVRKSAILDNPSAARSSDSEDLVVVAPNVFITQSQFENAQIPVYPWPQFFVETNDDKKGRFQIKYIGDPSVIERTKGYLYEKWPEVEFVEEYMRGLNQKFNPPLVAESIDNQNDTNEVNLNAIEFPQSDIAYVIKEEIKFLYEIWERQYVTSRYSGYNRAVNNQFEELIKLNTEVESKNIVNQIALNAVLLTYTLKNYKLNSTNYLANLENVSNAGTGKSWQLFIRDGYVTPYLKTDTENPFSILSVDDIGKNPLNNPNLAAFEQLIKNAPNSPKIVDTYPFTNYAWDLANLSDSSKSKDDLVFKVSDTMKVFQERNIISNFTDVNNFTVNRPVKNFSFLGAPRNPTPLNNFLISDFYRVRIETPNKLLATEGVITSISPTGSSIPFSSTTSMFNTPFFVNAIQQGTNNQRNGQRYPYVEAAYLFLNSLPLATLRERYKTATDTDFTELDYIASCFNKFGAIHKIPYPWILKMGSIWHRYKIFKQTGRDFLTNVWKDFDYKKNYYPPTSDLGHTYSFKYDKNNIEITAQKISATTINQEVGFYPQLISDYCYFLNGFDLYSGYTNTEIQESIDAGIRIHNYATSNINGVINSGKTYTEKTWSVIIPESKLFLTSDPCSPNNSSSTEYFICPSFGSNVNQVIQECVGIPPGLVPLPVALTELQDNKSIFNGSVRCLWSAPNYGYFDVSQAVKPPVDAYLNQINTGTTQYSFNIFTTDSYTKIEEIFSVFEKSQLDLMENQFLEFCKPEINMTGAATQSTFNQPTVNLDAQFKNFQLLMKSLMGVPAQLTQTNQNEYFNGLIQTQLDFFNNTIKNFMQYDLIIRNGNPTKYRRRVFDSFISYQNVAVVEDPLPFEPYVVGSLPDASGTVTLNSSITRYPREWRTLELEVGFSTIDRLRYTDVGSYITDFFIDCNIEFSVLNIQTLAPLIKMYATQKLKDSNYGLTSFQNALNDYSIEQTIFQNLLLDDLMSRLNRVLPDVQIQSERSIVSVIQGEQSKVENYEVFKALNDKWISGADWSEKTLFEDILFLDRASRDIGNTILIDIFSLKNTFNKDSINMNMSVYTFITSMLIKNNFTCMNLPAYVNFYNVQDVSQQIQTSKSEGSLEFANSLWGTFLDVDYRKSSPKMVCFYVGRPSEYLQLPKQVSRYRSDAFELRRTSDNPLLENPKGKTDWAQSNKCVGFNVDIGIRNQNIFYSFSVSQDAGKATSESLNAQLQITNQAGGKNYATQNVGLYNLYKNRSYQCTVVSLGNALLQPMMYFNLRHVPMFNGPYMIQEVQHTISPGNFQTQFTGIRQGVFDLPSIDNYLQSVNQNLLTKLEQIVKTNKEQSPEPKNTEQQKTSQIVDSSTNSKATPNSCVAKVNPAYLPPNLPSAASWTEKTDAVKGSKSPKEFADILRAKAPNLPVVRLAIYAICYLRTFNKKENTFSAWENNFATLSLVDDFSPAAFGTGFTKTYSCVNLSTSDKSKNNSAPIAHFKNFESFIDFMLGKLFNQTERIEEGLTQFYVCYWPKSDVSVQYFLNNRKQFESYDAIFDEALLSAEKAGVIDKRQAQSTSTQGKSGTSGKAGTSGSSGTSGTSGLLGVINNNCPPPVISSFSPVVGNSNTVITVSGKNFQNLLYIEVLGVKILTKDITVLPGGTQFKFTLPKPINPANPISPILVATSDGTTTSTTQIKFDINASTGAAAVPPPTQLPQPSPTPPVSGDKSMIAFAYSAGKSFLNFQTYKDGKLKGRWFESEGPLQSNHNATLYLLNKNGVKAKVADFVINNASGTPPNAGDFVSSVDRWEQALSAIADGDKQLVYFTVEIPDLQLKLTYSFSYMGFDCPTSGYVFGDVISIDDYETILENPCCACYANGTGGRRRIVLGKECNQTSNPC